MTKASEPSVFDTDDDVKFVHEAVAELCCSEAFERIVERLGESERISQFRLDEANDFDTMLQECEEKLAAVAEFAEDDGFWGGLARRRGMHKFFLDQIRQSLRAKLEASDE